MSTAVVSTAGEGVPRPRGPIPSVGPRLRILMWVVFALVAIKFFIGIVGRYGFKFFGVYRILLGVVVLTSFI